MKDVFDLPVITAIVTKHGKDNAQVLTRRALQKGCGLSLVRIVSRCLLTVVTLQVGDPASKGSRTRNESSRIWPI